MQVKKSFVPAKPPEPSKPAPDIRSFLELSKMVVNNFEIYAVDVINRLKDKAVSVKEVRDPNKSIVSSEDILSEDKFVVQESDYSKAIEEIKRIAIVTEDFIDNFPKYMESEDGSEKLKKQIRWDMSEKTCLLYQNDLDSRAIERMHKFGNRDELYRYAKNMCDTRRKYLIEDMGVLQTCFENASMIGNKRARDDSVQMFKSPKVVNPGSVNSAEMSKEK